MKRFLGAVAAVVLAGCGGSSGGGDVKGAVAGQEMKGVKDAVYVSMPTGVGGSMGVVLVSDQGDLCDLMKKSDESTDVEVRDASVLMFMLANVQGESFGAVNAGSYAVVSMDSEALDGRFAVALFDHVNGSGSSTVGEAGVGTGGAVTLASVEAKEGGGAEGTFSVKFGSDTLTGSFDAQYCDVPVTASAMRRLQRAAK